MVRVHRYHRVIEVDAQAGGEAAAPCGRAAAERQQTEGGEAAPQAPWRGAPEDGRFGEPLASTRGASNPTRSVRCNEKSLPQGRLFSLQLAERVGFEPTVRFNVRLISSQVHSTTLPPLRCFI